jgi:hypothetical protein
VTRREIGATLAIAVALAIAACGDSPSRPIPTTSDVGFAGKDREVKARLEAFFDVIRAGGGANAAGFVVYRGEKDPARRWKDVARYDVEEEKAGVDSVVEHAARYLAKGGPPTFLRFETHAESEGTWLVWHLRFGDEATGRKAAFACLEVAGRIAIGDIDRE